jgi:predicted metal-dependent HD superfamily phosphohydrolase
MVGFASADWKRFAVRQRRPLSGCIPTGYEMLLRAANVQDVDLDSFQDEFDLDQDVAIGVAPRNNFESVADAVRAKYPHLIFKSVSFATGAAKLAFIEELIAAQQLPVLVSLFMAAVFEDSTGWHIMPVVEASDDELTLLHSVLPDGRCRVLRVPKSDLVRIHDEFPGGKEVAYLAPVEAS